MTKPHRSRVLLVDDEPDVTASLRNALRREPFDIECADSGARALELLSNQSFDVIVSDERMPGMPGSELLSIVRQRHPDIVRIILSGQAVFDAALRAINSAEIYRFLLKPCPPEEIGLTVREALALRDRRLRFEAWEAQHSKRDPQSQRDDFEKTLQAMWIGFQPIVQTSDWSVHGYEALVRSDGPAWQGPSSFFSLAHKLGRALEVGRKVRDEIAGQFQRAPRESVLFVNANPVDFDDEALLEGNGPLAQHASRTVIEVTERESLSGVKDLDAKMQRLRDVGYRIAVDDLGAGYSGLNSLVLVQPDIVKFDMELVRSIDRSPTKQKLVGPMVAMCHDLGIRTLAEGVETRQEKDMLVSLGCELLQGFLFGKAEREFRDVIATRS